MCSSRGSSTHLQHCPTNWANTKESERGRWRHHYQRGQKEKSSICTCITQPQLKISSWTGFNIKVHEKENIVDSNVGYLQTLNAPATGMSRSTVNEIMKQSLSIMNSHFQYNQQGPRDQVKESKNADLYKPIVPRLGIFHTLCTSLSITGKWFQDAGLFLLC